MTVIYIENLKHDLLGSAMIFFLPKIHSLNRFLYKIFILPVQFPSEMFVLHAVLSSQSNIV